MDFKTFLYIALFGLVNSQMMMNISDCGQSIGCMKLPSTCDSFETCSAVGMWYYNSTSDMYNFHIYFTKPWAGFGQNTNTAADKMVGLLGFYCYYDGTNVGTRVFKSAGRAPPTLQEVAQQTVASSPISSSDGTVHKCSFQRTATSNDYLLALSETNLINIVAHGNGLQNDNINPQKHPTGADGGYVIGANPIADWKAFTGPATEPATTAAVTTEAVTTEAVTTEGVTTTTEGVTTTTEEVTTTTTTTVAPKGNSTGNDGDDDGSGSNLNKGSYGFVCLTILFAFIFSWM